MKFSMAAVLLLATTAQGAIVVNVIDQSGIIPAFGQPVITGNVADFPDVYYHGPHAVGLNDFDFDTLALKLDPPGTYRIAMGGGSYGVDNEVWLLTEGVVPASSVALTGVGPWTHTMDVTVAAVPGDYNGDGAANAADYTVWRNAGMGRPEFDVWHANYGRAMLKVVVVTVAGLGIGSQGPSVGVSQFSVEYLEGGSVPAPTSGELAGYLLSGLIGFLIGMPRRR